LSSGPPVPLLTPETPSQQSDRSVVTQRLHRALRNFGAALRLANLGTTSDEDSRTCAHGVSGFRARAHVLGWSDHRCRFGFRSIGIGEVIARTGLPASTRHLWERRGLIETVKRNGLRGQYATDIFERARTKSNHDDGDRGTYRCNPDGHFLEILTVPHDG
jgi:hypothetical protein